MDRTARIAPQSSGGIAAYDLGAQFVRSLFEENGITVAEDASLPEVPPGFLSLRYRDATLVFSLHHLVNDAVLSTLRTLPCDGAFLTAGKQGTVAPVDRVFAFSPPTFGFTLPGASLDWSVYRTLVQAQLYHGNEANLLCCQDLAHPRLEARRRLYRKVAELCVPADFTLGPPSWFFEKIRYSRVAVLANSGGTVDKAVLQLMSLGCPVITTRIEHQFPTEQPEAGVHYLVCAADFEDLPELLEIPVEDLLRLSHAGRDFFARNLTPQPLLRYIDDCLGLPAWT